MGDEPLTKADWIRAALERYERSLIRYAARITVNIELALDKSIPRRIYEINIEKVFPPQQATQ